MQAIPWVRHEKPGDYVLEHPPGWAVNSERSPLLIVASGDGAQRAILEPLGMVLGRGTPAEILRAGRFTATELFPAAVLGPIEEAGGAASCLVGFVQPDGRPGRALVTCRPTKWCNTIFAVAAPEPVFAQAGPSLQRILDSFHTLGTDQNLSSYEMQCAMTGTGRPGLNPAWKLRPAGPVGPIGPIGPLAPAGLSYVPFQDPIAAGFQVEVPRGWGVRGGLNHAGLGDRRWFVEVQSPDGNVVWLGDPECPQDFCHNAMVWGETMVAYPQGCTFLNLAADPKKLSAYYIKNVLPKRIGPVKVTAQRERKDLAAEEVEKFRQLGYTVARTLVMLVHEARIEAGGRTGCCFTSCCYDKSQPTIWMMGMTTWAGGVSLWLAPAGATAVAEQVWDRMRKTFRPLPGMNAVIQRDEAIITANGNNALMAQQAWFSAQQAMHRSQVAQGDAIMQNYWNQQHANDSISQSYWNTQQTYDRLSQDRSDAMLDRQRLSDDNMGQTYDASSGYNYYWLDQQSGQIYGTNTSDPPDYSRNYTQLRKM